MPKEVRNLGLILISVLVACGAFYYFIYSSDSSQAKATKPISSVPLIGNMVASHSYSYGPTNAKVTVVEFFDPECESCAAIAPLIKNEMKYYEGKVRWVFRYMAYHKNSRNAIKVLEAARKQNLFLEVQTALFTNQKVWGEQQESTEKQILDIASKVKSLNINQLKKDFDIEATESIINTDMSEGKQGGVTGTPTFFVNGVLLESPDPDLVIKSINDRL